MAIATLFTFFLSKMADRVQQTFNQLLLQILCNELADNDDDMMLAISLLAQRKSCLSELPAIAAAVTAESTNDENDPESSSPTTTTTPVKSKSKKRKRSVSTVVNIDNKSIVIDSDVFVNNTFDEVENLIEEIDTDKISLPVTTATTSTEKQFGSILNDYADDIFKHHFRMRKSTVEILCQLLSPYLQPQLHRHPYHPIENKILLTLFILSSKESFNSISERFAMSKGTAHILFVSVCNAIRSHLCDVYISWPTSEENCEVIASEFESKYKIPGIVGILGSIKIRVRPPQTPEHDYVINNGVKSSDAICLQIVCDHRMRFTDISTCEFTNASEADVLLSSSLGRRLTHAPDCFPNEKYHLVANVDCPLLPRLMVPFQELELSETQLKFNDALESVLMMSQQALERLLNRFKRLKNLDLTTKSIAVGAIESACVLHNVVIEHEADFDDAVLDEDERGVCDDLVEKEKIAHAKRNELLQIFQ